MHKTRFRWAMTILILLFANLCLGQCSSAMARGIGPENILLVVNATSPESLAIANHYIHFRDVPPQNVVYLNKITIVEGSDGSTRPNQIFSFRDHRTGQGSDQSEGTRGPNRLHRLFRWLPNENRPPSPNGSVLKQNGKKYDSKIHGTWGSITSQTYLAEQLFSPSIKIFESNANWYANPPIRNVLDNPFIGETAKRFESARTSFRDRDYANASLLFAKLVEQNPQQITVRYFLAQSLAMNRRQEPSDPAAFALSKTWLVLSFTRFGRHFVCRDQARR